MPIIQRCHFEEIFKKVVKRIEEEYDKDFEDKITFDLTKTDLMEMRLTVLSHFNEIDEQIWLRQFHPEEHSKERYERLLYEFIIFLMQMLRESMEEQKT